MNKFLMIMSILKPALEAAKVVDQIGDACIDAVEEIIQRTDNTVDDAIVLPALKGLRHITGLAEDKPQLEVLDNEA